MKLPPGRVEYVPIVDRPPISWPDGARVAFWVAPNVEHYEYTPHYDGIRNPWPRTPYPDVQQYSYRDYGNRIGFWRMLEGLDAHRVKCTVSLNLAVLEHFPELDDVNAMFDRKVPFARWGRMLTEAFEVLYVDGADNGRLLVLNLHPWLVGQPFRIRALDRALAVIMAREGVWAATGGEVAAWYRDHGRCS